MIIIVTLSQGEPPSVSMIISTGRCVGALRSQGIDH